MDLVSHASSKESIHPSPSLSVSSAATIKLPTLSSITKQSRHQSFGPCYLQSTHFRGYLRRCSQLWMHVFHQQIAFVHVTPVISAGPYDGFR